MRQTLKIYSYCSAAEDTHVPCWNAQVQILAALEVPADAHPGRSQVMAEVLRVPTAHMGELD